MPEKQAPDEVDDKTGQKVALYFASEFDFSVSSAHEAVETARRLAESLEAVSSGERFSRNFTIGLILFPCADTRTVLPSFINGKMLFIK